MKINRHCNTAFV